MRYALFLFILVLSFPRIALCVSHHERGQICIEDLKDTADIDMNDECLLWEAIYQTASGAPGENLTNGEILVLIKPMAYGAKNTIQTQLRNQSKINGIFHLHKDQTIQPVAPGEILINGPSEMFKTPCNYSSFINTDNVTPNNCESNAFAISGNNTNLVHPFLLSQLISFKNISINPNIEISRDDNSSFIYDMYYDSGFPKERVHFHDALIGQGKIGQNNSGTPVNLNECKITGANPLSQDCKEALKNYFSNLNDKSSLPQGAMKSDVCTANYSINKMSSFNNGPIFDSSDRWTTSSNGVFSSDAIEGYFNEQQNNQLISDVYHELRSKRKVNELSTISCSAGNENDEDSNNFSGGPYSGVTWGSDFAIGSLGWPLSSPSPSELVDIVDVTTNTGRGQMNFFGSFAALKNDGSVLTWGYHAYGGNSADTQNNLSSGVTKVYSNNYAFAAIKTGGDVVTWGLGSSGGDSSHVASQLESGVTKIYSTESAFAALKESSGSVVTWGFGDQSNHALNFGGDSSNLDLNSGVEKIFSTDGAFTALKSGGNIITWGRSDYGGEAPQNILNLTDIVDVFSANYAFAALRSNNEVVAWGHSAHGGTSTGVDLTNIKEVYGNKGAFAAIKHDGSVVAWGNAARGGLIPNALTSSLSSGVIKIVSTDEAFAALKSDGTVVAWGNQDQGGDISSLNLINIQDLYATHFAFAALDNNGKVISWGFGDKSNHPSNYGGDSSSVTSQISSGVIEIVPNLAAFAAIKSDGKVVTWGFGPGGGDSSSVSSDLTNGVKRVISAPVSFIGLKE